MDQPRRARRGPGRDVVLLDERGPQPARRRVEQRAGADDPAADDDDVPRSRGRAWPGRPRGARAAGRGRGGAVGRAVRGPAGRSVIVRAWPAAGARSATAASRCRRSGRRSPAACGRRPPGASVGRTLVRIAAPSTTATAAAATSRTSRQPGWRPTRRRVSHGRPPAGSRSARRGSCPACAAPRRVSRPVFGRWNVTVRSARTAGSDGSPLDRSTAVGVSTATTGTPAARARPMTSTADRIGSRRAPRTPVPSSASTTTAAFSMPWPKIATSRATGEMDLDDARCRARSGPSCGPPSAPRGRASAATTATMTDAPARASRRAATNPSPPLLPGPHRIDDRAAPPPIEVDGERPDGRRDRGPGVLHQPHLRVAERLGAAVGAGHRLGRDRRAGRPGPPSGGAARAGPSRRSPGRRRAAAAPRRGSRAWAVAGIAVQA